MWHVNDYKTGLTGGLDFLPEEIQKKAQAELDGNHFSNSFRSLFVNGTLYIDDEMGIDEHKKLLQETDQSCCQETCPACTIC
jgi:hypothetical protein